MKTIDKGLLNKWQALMQERKESYVNKFQKEAEAYKTRYSYRTTSSNKKTVDDLEDSLIDFCSVK